MRVLIEPAATGVQGTADADPNILLKGQPQYGTGGAAKQVVEQRPVIVKERPEQVWHVKSDVLPLAVGHIELLSNQTVL